MTNEPQKITVRPDGPYIVRGGIPLVRKKQVMSEHGEPLAWQKENDLSTKDVYRLCRCGQSSNKPFCDGSETADTGPISSRQKTFSGPNLSVEDDHSICVHSGFCGNRITNIWKMIEQSDDTQVRAQIMAMIDRCPSGTLSYTLEPGGEIIEPDLTQEVTVIPDGPLWITGGIPVERSDWQPLETRNRVTLCRCGASKNKPLCDGTHKEIGFSDT